MREVLYEVIIIIGPKTVELKNYFRDFLWGLEGVIVSLPALP